MTDHTGNVTLVTGAGAGIGRASAELFAKHGAKVAAADIDLETAKATVARIEAAGEPPVDAAMESNMKRFAAY